MNYITIQQPHKVMGTIFLGGESYPCHTPVAMYDEEADIQLAKKIPPRST
jgi:hypothetical protein